MLYVHPAAAGQGAGAMLCDALEKLAAARGAKELTVEASDTARGFFEKRGYVAQHRNTVIDRRRMARQHHDEQTARRQGDRAMKRTDTPFPRHWLYYHRSLKYAVIAAAIVRRALHRLSALSRLMAMARERLYLFDTTLRDGAQTNGVDFTLADKLAIARMLDELGIDYVEGGYPGANPTDTDFFRRTAAAARQSSPRSA